MSYESPIDIIYGDMQTKLEGDVFKAIQNYNIEVNKDELLKALAYDRNQYHKGWLDGYAQAVEDIVRCKDCKWFDRISDNSCFGYCHAAKHCFNSKNWDVSIYRTHKEDFYCADGERKEAEDETD